MSNQIGSKKDKLETFLIIVNGLDYFQLMDLADVKPIKNEVLADEINESGLVISTNEYPLVNMKQFYQTWELSDLTISMDSELYKEISYKLLKVELLIKDDGAANLLSTCREVSDEMKTALEESIDYWQIRKKMRTAETVRFVYGIPAPAEAGAYVDCDDSWRL
jgi:hypothetical protein